MASMGGHLRLPWAADEGWLKMESQETCRRFRRRICLAGSDVCIHYGPSREPTHRTAPRTSGTDRSGLVPCRPVSRGPARSRSVRTGTSQPARSQPRGDGPTQRTGAAYVMCSDRPREYYQLTPVFLAWHFFIAVLANTSNSTSLFWFLYRYT